VACIPVLRGSFSLVLPLVGIIIFRPTGGSQQIVVARKGIHAAKWPTVHLRISDDILKAMKFGVLDPIATMTLIMSSKRWRTSR